MIPRARPFLKWAGGKGQLLESYEPLLPPRFARYHEPFAGGGAVFFHLRASHSAAALASGAKGAAPGMALSDINEELIDCYRVVQGQVEALIEALGRHRYDRDHYYAVRALDPSALSPVERAARTIFLNRTGFNGLYRVNRGGRFNVPFGRYTRPTICDAENLRACAAVLRGAELASRDFAQVTASAEPGDFVYLDPPYPPVSPTSCFTGYVPGGFGWSDHLRLARVFRDLDRRGIFVMLSSSDVPQVREVYRDYTVVPLEAPRSMNSRSGGQRRARELLIRNY